MKSSTPTFDEYKVAAEEKQAERAADHRPQLEMLRQAAVKAELLPGYPGWDTFMSYLQAAMEATVEQAEVLRRVVLDPMMVDHDQLMRAKLGLAQCEGRIDAWKAAIELPADIGREGEKAKKLLERLPEIAA